MVLYSAYVESVSIFYSFIESIDFDDDKDTLLDTSIFILFQDALYNFFHNGFRLRIKIVRKVIQKLDQLRRVIERQSSYRFYSW